MTRALLLLGIAYRMRRCRRLLHGRRIGELRRVLAATERDFAKLES